MQLVHHGVRCAHLYLSQSQAELPGMLSAVTTAQELRAANRQVGSTAAGRGKRVINSSQRKDNCTSASQSRFH